MEDLSFFTNPLSDAEKTILDTLPKNHSNKAWFEQKIGNINLARKNNNFTLRQVEEITGISNSYLSQLETGKIKNPSFEVIQKLYKLLGESIFYY